MSLAEAIKREARALGFDAVGISRVANSSQPSAFSLTHPFPTLLPPYPITCSAVSQNGSSDATTARWPG